MKDFTISTQAGKVYVEHRGVWGESGIIEVFLPDEADEFAATIITAAADARKGE